VFSNEGAKEGWNGLWHYYHFAAENVLGGLAALAATDTINIHEKRREEIVMQPVPERIAIPWEPKWQDRFGMNEMVIRGLWDQGGYMTTN
jgi:hypothetical protein